MSEYFFYVAHHGTGVNANGVSAVDPASGQIHATVSLGAPGVRDLVAVPGSALLYALVDDEVEIRVIDVASLAVVAAVNMDAEETWFTRRGSRRITSLAVSRDGSRLYAGYSKGIVEIDTTTRTPVRTLLAGEEIEYLCASPDGTRLYATDCYSVFAVDLATGEHHVSDLAKEGGRLALSPDGSRLYSCNDDVPQQHGSWPELHALDTDTLQVTARCRDVSDLRDVAVLPDGKRLLAIEKDHVSVRDAATLQEMGVFFAGGHRGILSPDGELLCTVGDTEARLIPATANEDDDPRVVTLPGTAVAVTTGAPVGAPATRLSVTNGRVLVPVTVPGLTAHLVTDTATPVSGAPVRFVSAGGLDLGTATTDATGHATHTASLLLPLDPATGSIDTSALTGPYTATYRGTPAYKNTQATGTITLT
ncbi:hypothetical protein [Streptomyces sp. HUAS TT7]|uniref:WD40 repeat domain-containing protein n=1 Tax=Streptomyces sp. HUAS TT7 TaxID=3447507 RepID=UPI003F657180